MGDGDESVTRGCAERLVIAHAGLVLAKHRLEQPIRRQPPLHRERELTNLAFCGAILAPGFGDLPRQILHDCPSSESAE